MRNLWRVRADRDTGPAVRAAYGSVGDETCGAFEVRCPREIGGARPFNLQWARKVVEQCREASVAPFVKQVGAAPYLHYVDSHESRLVGGSLKITEHEHRADYSLRDRKGGDWDEWPADLRVREFPR